MNHLTARIRQKNAEFLESLNEYPWVLEHKPHDRDSWYPFDSKHGIFRDYLKEEELADGEDQWLGPTYQKKRRLKLDDALACMVNYMRESSWLVVKGAQLQIRNEITGEVIPWDALGE